MVSCDDFIRALFPPPAFKSETLKIKTQIKTYYNKIACLLQFIVDLAVFSFKLNNEFTNSFFRKKMGILVATGYVF